MSGQIVEENIDDRINNLFNSLTFCELSCDEVLQARLRLLEKFSLSQEISKTLNTCKKEDLKVLKSHWLENQYMIDNLQKKMDFYCEIKHAIDKSFTLQLIQKDILSAHQNTQKAIEEIENAQKQHRFTNKAKKIAIYANYQKHLMKQRLQENNTLKPEKMAMELAKIRKI